jgi:hypothetical protein
MRRSAKLLERIAWPGDGRRLFEIAVFASSCAVGFLRPSQERSFLGVSVAK